MACFLNVCVFFLSQTLFFFFIGWRELWEKGIFPWHEDAINPKLEKHWSTVFKATGKSSPKECRFFVPLCGKSQDLLFLHAKGFQVIGCEGVHQACIDFFKGNSNFSP